MKRTHIEICTGTACFVMGGADLLLLKEELLTRWKQYGVTETIIDTYVHISGTPCAGHCRNSTMKPPFITIDGKLIGSASLDAVVELLFPYIIPSLEELHNRST